MRCPRSSSATWTNAGVQTSSLELNEHSITVDKNGKILEPYGATQFGYFSFERLAMKTPREYRPDGFTRNSQTANMMKRQG